MAEIQPALWADYVPQSERPETAANTTETTRKPNDELDKNSFLMLLITQMQYQDPLNPVEDKEFIAQMAQFSALEQMQNLNATMTTAQTYGMIGKYVIAETYNDETGEYSTVGGLVESVTVKNKVPLLYVDGQEIELSEVTDVTDNPYLSDLATAESKNSFMAQSIALIGRYIQAITYNADGAATGFVEGRVDNVKVTDGTPILVVGGKDIYPQELIQVSDDMMLLGKTIKVLSGNENGKDIYVDKVIKKVDVTGETARLVLDDGEAEIDKIDTLTEALKRVGQSVETADGVYSVTGVTIDGQIPYLLTEDGKKIDFAKVIR